MGQQTADQIAFLQEARKALEELEILKDREKQLKIDEVKVGKTLDMEKKAAEDAVNSTIRKRRDAICSSYDKEMDKAEERLKKARTKREKAKNQGMKERIAEETADLRSENRDLESQIRVLFKKKRVPGYCNSRWYYALFLPRWFGEFFTFLVTVLVCFAAIPYGSYLLIPDRKQVYLVGIYVLTIVIFGGIYVWISNRTKARHMETLKEGRVMRDHIRSNKKKIRLITKSIQKDKNEKQYNLEKYDDEIAQEEQEIHKIGNQKQDAMNTFEQVTKAIISDEILTGFKPKLDELSAGYRDIKKAINEVEDEIKEKNLMVTDRYAGYLGREYMNPIKIGELVELLRSGKASNLNEAMQAAREAKDV